MPTKIVFSGGSELSVAVEPEDLRQLLIRAEPHGELLVRVDKDPGGHTEPVYVNPAQIAYLVTVPGEQTAVQSA